MSEMTVGREEIEESDELASRRRAKSFGDERAG